LDRIVQAKQEEKEASKHRRPLPGRRSDTVQGPPARDIADPVTTEGGSVGLITKIKLKRAEVGDAWWLCDSPCHPLQQEVTW
jgi:hypothetical protein